jgi:hypothetical protein
MWGKQDLESDQRVMSPIRSVTLNKMELTRIVFSSQENDDHVQFDSEKFLKIQVICGKNAENCMKKQEGNMLFVFMSL